MASTPIGHVITAFMQDSHHLYTCYVHDFLKSIHRCNYPSSETMDLEYKVMTEKLVLSVLIFFEHLGYLQYIGYTCFKPVC